MVRTSHTRPRRKRKTIAEGTTAHQGTDSSGHGIHVSVTHPALTQQGLSERHTFRMLTAMHEPGILIFVGFLILAGGLAIYGVIRERKRREAFAKMAQHLGMTYHGGRDYRLATRFGFLDKLAKGQKRYAFNTLSSQYRGQEVHAFDYHYETHSHDSKGRRQTHHHYLSCFVLVLPRSFPELTIAREGLFSKIAQAVGYDDIDFESHEFSRRFCVRSKDKKFAYDFCHARMIEYLLENPDLNIEVDIDTLALVFDRRLAVDEIPRNLERLQTIRDLMPDYLFAATP